ncbi:hypothetical protein Tco_0654781 [Tanacetum coccineum]|uniref:Uncharacterized protein n=1 Tax=Tanacetum coccineum TaxID=301880 RepID=A0ABQ4X4G8_9ASTR
MFTYLEKYGLLTCMSIENKSFEEIQMLFDNTMKWVDSFVPIDSEVVKGIKARQKEMMRAEMKKHMEIVHDDEVAVDAIPLATKPPIIVDWKIIKEGNMGYFQIIRADGSSRRSYALSWKPCQGDSLNLPNHRIHKDGDGDASFQLKSDSLPHVHAHSTKTFYKHQDLKNQESSSIKDKDFCKL